MDREVKANIYMMKSHGLYDHSTTSEEIFK